MDIGQSASMCWTCTEDSSRACVGIPLESFSLQLPTTGLLRYGGPQIGVWRRKWRSPSRLHLERFSGVLGMSPSSFEIQLLTMCSWSPDGAHITASNATNNQGFVFIAAVIARNSWTSEISLVGHENTVEVSVCSFIPIR